MVGILRTHRRTHTHTRTHLRTPWALCAPGWPTLFSFLLGTLYLLLWWVAFDDRVVAPRPKGLFLLGDKPHPPLLYRFGRLPLRGRMRLCMRALPGGRMPLHTCDRTRADGPSTPLRGVLFYQKKNLPPDLEFPETS